ncbi:MAG: DUF5522 domain-containing protein [Cyclobacteriaceae bacterium]
MEKDEVVRQKKSQSTKMDSLEEEDFYYDDRGFIVFTKQYHLKRGYCCKSGCRHCPYDFKRGGKPDDQGISD